MDSVNICFCHCGKSFQYHYLLKRHHEGHRGCEYTKSLKKVSSESNEFICTKCYKKLTTKFNLERHTKICIINNSIKQDIGENNMLNNLNKSFQLYKSEIYNVYQKYQNIMDTINKLRDENPTNNSIKDMISDITKLSNVIKELNVSEQINTTPIITTGNSNIDIEQLINIRELDSHDVNTNNNTTNNTNSNNTTNNNTTNNNTTNNTTNITNNNNNSPTIYPIIYPFGYENLSFLSRKEMLNILTSPTCLSDAMEKIFSRQEHKSYYKRNANRPQIAVINKQFNTKIYTDREFKNEMIKTLLMAIQRMFYICKNDLDFDEQVILWQNIKILKTNYTDCLTIKNEKDLPSNVKTIMDNIYNLVLGDKEIENVYDNFTLFKNKITKDTKYKEALLNLLQSIIKELEDYNNDLENITIDEETLESYWDKPTESIDLNHRLNNINETDYKDTPRNKYNEKMINIENDKLNENIQSIGNVNEVIAIRDERKEEEINNLVEHFNLSSMKKIKLRTDLIVKPKNELSNAVKTIRKKHKT